MLFLLMNLLFYLTLSFSDDLVQLCVDYLREYPLLVGSGLACPVSFSFYTVNYFDQIFIQSIIFIIFLYNHFDHLLQDTPAPGFLVADEGRR